MHSQKGLILTITIIFVLILVIMAGIALILMTNHTRITESQIRRMRTSYAMEAAIVDTLEALRTNSVTPLPTPGSPTSRPVPVPVDTNGDGKIDSADTIVTVNVKIYAKGDTSCTPSCCPSSSPSDYCVRANLNY